MMNWYLNIRKGGRDRTAMMPLGDIAKITKHMNAAFPGICWESATEAKSIDEGFSLKLSVEKGMVHIVILRLGKTNVNSLAAVCKQQGWRLEDPNVETEDDVDLDEPEQWWKDTHG